MVRKQTSHNKFHFGWKYLFRLRYTPMRLIWLPFDIKLTYMCSTTFDIKYNSFIGLGVCETVSRSKKLRSRKRSWKTRLDN